MKNTKETDRQMKGTLEKQRERTDQIARNKNQPDMDSLDDGI